MSRRAVTTSQRGRGRAGVPDGARRPVAEHRHPLGRHSGLTQLGVHMTTISPGEVPLKKAPAPRWGETELGPDGCGGSARRSRTSPMWCSGDAASTPARTSPTAHLHPAEAGRAQRRPPRPGHLLPVPARPGPPHGRLHPLMYLDCYVTALVHKHHGSCAAGTGGREPADDAGHLDRRPGHRG
jgi:hypothetical protein